MSLYVYLTKENGEWILGYSAGWPGQLPEGSILFTYSQGRPYVWYFSPEGLLSLAEYIRCLDLDKLREQADLVVKLGELHRKRGKLPSFYSSIWRKAVWRAEDLPTLLSILEGIPTCSEEYRSKKEAFIEENWRTTFQLEEVEWNSVALMYLRTIIRVEGEADRFLIEREYETTSQARFTIETGYGYLSRRDKRRLLSIKYRETLGLSFKLPRLRVDSVLHSRARELVETAEEKGISLVTPVVGFWFFESGGRAWLVKEREHYRLCVRTPKLCFSLKLSEKEEAVKYLKELYWFEKSDLLARKLFVFEGPLFFQSIPRDGRVWIYYPETKLLVAPSGRRTELSLEEASELLGGVQPPAIERLASERLEKESFLDQIMEEIESYLPSGRYRRFGSSLLIKGESGRRYRIEPREKSVYIGSTPICFDLEAPVSSTAMSEIAAWTLGVATALLNDDRCLASDRSFREQVRRLDNNFQSRLMDVALEGLDH